MKSIPKVSIIIPVYNAQDYLRRCLDSVCNQTLKDIEIICVNDCSTDSSAEILEEYLQKYKNLIVRNLEKNQGESTARNAGLALAQGEYLSFVDNDDEIDLNFCEKLYEKAHTTNADIVKGQTIETDYDGRKHCLTQLPKGEKLFFVGYWWNAIYRKSLIVENKISFSTRHSLGGDLLFLNRALLAANKLELVDNVYYYYHRRENSGDSKVLSGEKIKSVLNIFEIIMDNVNSNVSINSPIYSFLFHHFIMSCFHLSLRNDEVQFKKLCAETAIKIFRKCPFKSDAKLYFPKTLSYLFILFEENDIGEIENAFIKCKSRMEIIAFLLRCSVKKQQNYDKTKT